MDMLFGLDVGQLVDPAAASVIRRSLAIDPRTGRPVRDSRGRAQYKFDVIALKRYELGTPYERIIEHVVGQLGKPRFRPRTLLCLDATGIGRHTAERFRTAVARMPHVSLFAVTITGGLAVSCVGRGEYHVAKTELVGGVHGVLGSRRLTVPPSLPNADVLKMELANFQVKMTKAAHETYSAREGQHDDLLLSVAIPIFVASLPVASMREPDPGEAGAFPVLRRESDAVAVESAAIAAEELEALAEETGAMTPARAARIAAARSLARANPLDDRLWGWSDQSDEPC